MSDSTKTIVVVAGVGLVGYAIWRQYAAKQAAAAAAARTAAKATTSTKNSIVSDLVGILGSKTGAATLTSAAGGFAKWFGSTGQVGVERSTATLSGSTALTSYFAPASTTATDYGFYNFGDDSTNGSTVDPAEYAYIDQLS